MIIYAPIFLICLASEMTTHHTHLVLGFVVVLDCCKMCYKQREILLWEHEMTMLLYSLKMPYTEIPAYQISQESLEEDEQVHFPGRITKRTS